MRPLRLRSRPGSPVTSAALGKFVAVAALLIAWLLASPAQAATGTHAGGRIVLALAAGRSGPLVLTPGQGGWIGTFSVLNTGAEPLIVSRVAIRGDEDDVRSPSRLSVRFAEGAATSATLPPGMSKDVIVSWMPDRDPRVRQAFGHVVVTSSDEETGEIAMGFRAQVGTGLGWVGEHALTALVALPLLVLLVAVALRLVGRRESPLVRRASIGTAAVELLLALWVYRHFSPDVGRQYLNDGFQLVDRAVWVRSIGAEWYVGVDGISVALVLLAAIVGLVAVVVARGPTRRTDGYYCALSLLASGLMGTLVGLDLVVFFASWQVLLFALVLLIGGWGRVRSEHAAVKLAMYGALGSAALFAVLVALSHASGRALLVDGTAVAHTMSIPELARTSFAAKDPILGVPFVDALWLLLLIAAAVAAPIVPLHGWLPEALDEAPAGAALILGGLVVAVGPYLLLRVGVGAMPEGARWAGATLCLLGVLGVAYGSLCAMAQRDLKRFVAYASIANTGACLFGIGAFTPEGMAGAVVGLVAHGLSAAILLGVAAAFEERVRTSNLLRLGGLGDETPLLGILVAIGLALSFGVPGLAGFWGMLLVLLGGFARHPVLALLLAVGLTASAAAHLRIARLVLFGQLDPAWRSSPQLEPFGGRVPDARPHELSALLPLAALALLLGLWPAALMAQIADGVRDASTAVEPAGPIPTAAQP
jgi:NADH-quinone oxidoreductase subunit M